MAPIRFVGSPAHTLGVEVEVSLIDPETRTLSPAAPALLKRLDAEWAKPELFQTIIEVVTGVCKNTAEVRADIAGKMTALQKAAEAEGVALACTGTHPIAQWHEFPITDDQRYLQLIERMQWPARRLLICGIHIHVGVPTGEHAVAILNSLCCFLPHFVAASASSPFWLGLDTGLASSRVKVFEGLPTAGLPPQIANWAEFVALMRTLVGAGSIQTIREIWWDVRPHPGFGTVELRMSDGVNTLSEICALAAYAQCLVAFLTELYDSGEALPLLKRWTLAENKWRAARFAEHAKMIRNERGQTVPISEHILEWMNYLLPYAERLGCTEDLAYLGKILEHGPSYRRQRSALEELGSLESVVDVMIQELKEDRPWHL